MKPVRRVVPMKVQRDVALAQLSALMRAKGFEVDTFELDHDPALGLRPVDPVTGEHTPHQHDPAALVWRPKAEHKRKTTGRRGESKLSLSYDGDQSRIAKADRLEESTEEFRRRLLAKEPGQQRQRVGSIPARPRRPVPPQHSATRPIDRSRP